MLLVGAPVYAAPIESRESATFALYCYWTGEATLGRVPGVEVSRIGHLDGREIVQVDYDPGAVDLPTLVRALQAEQSFDALVVNDHEERISAREFLPRQQIIVRQGETDFVESKHSLRIRHPDLYRLPLTERQAIALNSWSYFGGEQPDVLSVEELQLWEQIDDKIDAGASAPPALPDGRGAEELAEYRDRLMRWLER